MQRKGFTLTELLIVIVIIGIIAVIAIPSIVRLNETINNRLYSSKVDTIEAAAKLYASDNPDIFNGKTEVTIYVSDLINGNYLEAETIVGDSGCITNEELNKLSDTDVIDGCILNPVDKTSMNSDSIILRKDSVGVSASFNGDTLTSEESEIVAAICNRFKHDADGNSIYIGKFGTGDNDYCECNSTNTRVVSWDSVTKTTGATVSACLITGTETNNYLLYDNVYWRVMGVYDIYNDGTKLSVKMISDDNVILDN